MEVIKVGAGDPGTTDPFAFVGVEGYINDDKIYVKYAKQWKMEKQKHWSVKETDAARDEFYRIVGDGITEVHGIINMDIIAVEKNNDGKRAIEIFEDDCNLTITPIVTTGDINNAKTIQKGFAMDKNKTVCWFAQQKKLHNIIFSENENDGDMQELLKQVSTFTRYATPTHTKYRAAKSGHDDLMMALLIACDIIRKLREQRSWNK